VAQQALRLIDDGQPDSFSMRQLADALGVGVMTIYGYVQNKKELYEAVFELAFSEVSAPSTDECEWYELVRATVGELYTLCRRHPNLISIALTAQLKPALFSRRARILDALEGAGFPQPVALRALGTVVSYTIGFVVSGSWALRAVPDDVNDDGATLPNLAHADSRFTYFTDLSEDAFRYGLDLLIHGLQADLAELNWLADQPSSAV
jgi:AcrR family transcriptional regulator